MTPTINPTAYGCDVTYCTNKELVFDYLKDRLVVGQMPSQTHLRLERLHDPGTAQRLLLRGLHYAIVDEADSVLVDEARTPLIIAQRSNETMERAVYEQALALAGRLIKGEDFLVDQAEHTVRLTACGEASVARLAQPLGSVWKGRRRREAFVHQALLARHLFHREQHYLVQEETVRIIDEYNGRVMPDRAWERGLHQMIEVKEGCPLGQRQETLARISYQRFFRRYIRLAGMTGTAREVAGELWSVYRLGVYASRPIGRPKARAFRINPRYRRREMAGLVRAIADAGQSGRSVLGGTRTVAASDHLSGLLTRHGFTHRVLNARQDGEEAAIIAEAGRPGGPYGRHGYGRPGDRHSFGERRCGSGRTACDCDGRHEARRIDRQLFGRCGRQGDRGTYQAILSLEDELIRAQTGPLLRWISRSVFALSRCTLDWTGGPSSGGPSAAPSERMRACGWPS